MSHEVLELKTEHLYSSHIKDTGKTHAYEIISQSSHAVLGLVKWNPQWRGYWLVPAFGTGFNDNCLESLFQFIRDLNQAWKEHRRSL